MSYSSLAEMFYKTCDNFPDKTALMYKDEGEYQSLLFKEIRDQVENLATSLLKTSYGQYLLNMLKEERM